MSDLAFSCPWCDQHLKAPSDMAGDAIACPSCEKEIKVPAPANASRPATRRLPKPDPGPQFPIIIRSSTRALYAKYIWRAIGWTFGLTLVITATWLLNALAELRPDNATTWLWFLFLVLLSSSLGRIWLDYRRIKHTEYRIFPNKIEATSYLFRFLGAYNNVVNLAQLRQIQAHRNSLLDLWFFGCGKITLTVSGDVADFVLTNIHRPEVTRHQIEEVVFGRDNVQCDTGPAPEVSH